MNLLESSFEHNKGFEINNPGMVRNDIFLLGESQSRVVVSISQEFKNSLTDLLGQNNINFVEVGRVTGSKIRFEDLDLGNISDWKSVYQNHLGQLIES